MISIRKGAAKRCRYGKCKNDTRYKSDNDDTYYFISFPKPCLEYRKKRIKISAEEHIKRCSKCTKCNLWVKNCGRKGFRSIDNVTKDTYICSLHFYGESGPTDMNPDPLIHQEVQEIDKSNGKVMKKYCGESGPTKMNPDRLSYQNVPEIIYIKVEMEEQNEPQKTDTNNIATIQQVSTAHKGVDIFDKKPSFIQEKMLPYQSSEMNTVSGDTNNEGINKSTRTIEIQTDSTRMCNKLLQVTTEKLQKNSALENFLISVRNDKKKCVFYTGFSFEQIQDLHRFLSPACENLNYVRIRKVNNGSPRNDKYKLTSMQQLLLVLLRLRMGYLIEDLAYQFDISVGLVSQICTIWINFLYFEFSTRLDPLILPSINIPETLPNDKTLPNMFQSVKNIKVTVTKFRLLQTILPVKKQNKLAITQQIVFVCSCLVNFQAPIVNTVNSHLSVGLSGNVVMDNENCG
ncbi:uncharacterized protein LOC114332348 [Diabrotica virgifera virgifera]|uniref:THAP-type domain-containing protein n=1 Tax=Diabrotica virgifera virgifera TaxID=50390 RepID=A0ABM5IP98_DIAVI|nr:uncharacterized protein LOC114332348 [Diabrotica virgifera virgifera]